MTWVLVTVRWDADDVAKIVQVVDCGSYERATRLEDIRRQTLPAPMWSHHIRRTFDVGEELPTLEATA
jgi:hypothetical protein